MTRINAQRVINDITTIYNGARWCSTQKLTSMLKSLARQLKSEGFSDVEVLNVPGNGKSQYGGWGMPIAWSPKSAILRDVSAPKNTTLVNYKVRPHGLMMYSRGTPKNGVCGDLVLLPDTLTPARLRRLKGKIVLHDKYNAFDLNTKLVNAGVKAIVCDYVPPIKGIKEGAYLDEALAYHNASLPCCYVPLSKRGLGVVITPAQGRRLRERLATGESISLHAKVDVSIGKTPTPLLTFRVPGKSQKDILLTGHIDEPGASDNASGPAMAFEIARHALAKASSKSPLLHGIRVVCGIEVRSLQWLMNAKPRYVSPCIAGLNLDMVCTNPRQSKAPLTVINTLPNCPDFTLPSLLDVFKEVIATSSTGFKQFPNDFNDNGTSDPYFNAPVPILMLCPDSTYHTDLDTPTVCDASSIRDMGQLIKKHVFRLASGSKRDRELLESLTRDYAMQQLNEARKLIKSGKVLQPSLFVRQRIIRERTRLENVSLLFTHPGSGLNFSPFERRARSLLAACAEMDTNGNNHSGDDKNLRSKAERMTLKKTFRGFLSLANIPEHHRKGLWRVTKTTQQPWGAPVWLQYFLNLCDGSRNVYACYGACCQEFPTPDLQTVLAVTRQCLRAKLLS